MSQQFSVFCAHSQNLNAFRENCATEWNTKKEAMLSAYFQAVDNKYFLLKIFAFQTDLNNLKMVF